MNSQRVNSKRVNSQRANRQEWLDDGFVEICDLCGGVVENEGWCSKCLSDEPDWDSHWNTTIVRKEEVDETLDE